MSVNATERREVAQQSRVRMSHKIIFATFATYLKLFAILIVDEPGYPYSGRRTCGPLSAYEPKHRGLLSPIFPRIVAVL
jgi:hypothetical protein